MPIGGHYRQHRHWRLHHQKNRHHRGGLNVATLNRIAEKWRVWNDSRRRNKEISASLPEAIDLWVLIMQAGLDFQVALMHYLDKAPHNALWDELSLLQTEIRTGRSRADALRNLA